MCLKQNIVDIHVSLLLENNVALSNSAPSAVEIILVVSVTSMNLTLSLFLHLSATSITTAKIQTHSLITNDSWQYVFSSPLQKLQTA